MVTAAHTRLIEALAEAERVPEAAEGLARWLHGNRHLELLRGDVRGDELILATLSPKQTCINSYVVPANLPELTQDILSLEDWSPNPHHHRASGYGWDSSNGEVRINGREGGGWRSLPNSVYPLVFFRETEGWSGEGGVSHEIAQEFIHASSIHWRRERSAYAKLDFRGDWDDIVSQSTEDKSAYADLFSVRREWIDLYLFALEAVLVRVFDFTLRKPSLPYHFDYREHVSREFRDDTTFQYREQRNEGNFNFIRGVQIVEPRLSSFQANQLVEKGRILDPSEAEPIEFIVLDWRNGRVTSVSTDSSTTTNYFQAENNSLPFDTSPAFFRPEVLGKYRNNSDKYTVHDTWIQCRGLWSLSYSVNDEGQIGVYICDLRDIAHEEQQYWASFNERPKAGLSKRTITTDFDGQWPEETTPREELVEIIRHWNESKIGWWNWRAAGAPELFVGPRTESPDEWAYEILALSNGVIGSFVSKELRQVLRDMDIKVDKDWGPVPLLEKILVQRGIALPSDRLRCLREIKQIRDATAHGNTKEKDKLGMSALDEHGTYAKHFQYLCDGLAKELTLVEQGLGGQ